MLTTRDNEILAAALEYLHINFDDAAFLFGEHDPENKKESTWLLTNGTIPPLKLEEIESLAKKMKVKL